MNSGEMSVEEVHLLGGEFLEFYNEYYMSEHSDADVTDYTTQPYYQSMHVERKRLEEKGLRMSTQLMSTDYRDEVMQSREGMHHAVVNVRGTRTRRTFLKGDQIIYKEEHDELARICFLQSNVDGNAECPNCGHVGNVASYINGCDYCGSKYEVKEFDPKISAFSLNEDEEKMVEKIWKSATGIVRVISALLVTVFYAAMVTFMIQLISAQDARMSEAIVDIGILMIIPIVRFVLFAMVIYFTFRRYFMAKFGRSVENEQLPISKIENFSVQDFFQHVEMCLNQIFLAQKESDVQAYAYGSLKEIVEANLDVIDSHLVALKFLEVEGFGETRFITAEATMVLYKYVDEKIQKERNKVTFKIEMDKDYSSRNMMFLTAYRCGKCGSTIDIMKGGVCEYCQNELSTEDVGFRFVKVDTSPMPKSIAPKIIGITVVAFILLFVINCFIPSIYMDGLSPIQTVYAVTNQKEFVEAQFDNVPLPENIMVVRSFVEETLNTEKALTTRDCYYRVSGGYTIVELYAEALERDGYTIEEMHYDSFVAKIESDSKSKLDTGRVLCVTVTVDGSDMTIHMEME